MRQDLAASGVARAKIAAKSSRNAAGFVAADRALALVAPIMGSELYGHRLAVGLGGLEELAGLEVEHAGQNVGGENLNPRIQIAHHRVVVAPGVLDGVLRLAQRS